MSHEIWSTVDEYLEKRLLGDDVVLEKCLEAASKAGLPEIQVSPTQGKQLYLLAKMIGARTILEVGTLGGYSSIWMARALPEAGRLVTLEIDPKHASVARGNFALAGQDQKIRLIEGPALDSLATLEREGFCDVDLTFIDADKQTTPQYFEFALKFSRAGSVIVVDNVIRDGRVIDQGSTDEGVLGTQRFLETVGQDRRVEVTAIQTVGNKGYDGFALALVR